MKKCVVSCAAILLGAMGQAASADITGFSQDFEAMDAFGATELGDDGWIVGANVWDEFYFTYLYNYFAFPAPNSNDGGGDRFSGIAENQGGPEQGNNVLLTISDYNNGDHALGYYIEANFYKDFPVAASNVGETWTFSFDAKLGNIGENTDPTANATAFIKTIDPANGYALTNFLNLDMTNADPTWQRYEIQMTITPDLVGQLFQVGFLNLCTLYEPSGMFYDNIVLSNGSAPSCQADLNGDGILDNGDIGAFVAAFLASDLVADFNGDGILDNGDIGAFVAGFLAGCP